MATMVPRKKAAETISSQYPLLDTRQYTTKTARSITVCQHFTANTAKRRILFDSGPLRRGAAQACRRHGNQMDAPMDAVVMIRMLLASTICRAFGLSI